MTRISKYKQNEPIAVFKSEEKIVDGIGTALTVILRTVGCFWADAPGNGCTMCGYKAETVPYFIKEKDLLEQFQRAVKDSRKIQGLKIFTSGSFFDPIEISGQVRKNIESWVIKNELEELTVETRPEFVVERTIREMSMRIAPAKLVVAIGLESSNDAIRKKNVNKGFTFKDFTEAHRSLKNANAITKAYLLLKPPHLTEQKAKEDIISSISDVAALGVHLISVNPVIVHPKTIAEILWKKGQYFPPNLWTLVDVLIEGKKANPGITIISDPYGGELSTLEKTGDRYPKSCFRCQYQVIKAIRKFSLSQDVHDLERLSCICKLRLVPKKTSAEAVNTEILQGFFIR